MLFDKVLHLLLGEGVDGLGKLEAGLGAPVLNDLVGAEALVALAAVHQRIGEAAEMAARHQVCGFIRIAASRPTL